MCPINMWDWSQSGQYLIGLDHMFIFLIFNLVEVNIIYLNKVEFSGQDVHGHEARLPQASQFLAMLFP